MIQFDLFVKISSLPKTGKKILPHGDQGYFGEKQVRKEKRKEKRL